MTKQTPARECSSCTAQVWDYLQAECFVRPLPKGRKAQLPFVLLFPPLKREEQRTLPLPESSLTSAQPSDPTPPLPFFQLLCCFSPVSSSLCFQGSLLLRFYPSQFQWAWEVNKWSSLLGFYLFTHLCPNSIRTVGKNSTMFSKLCAQTILHPCASRLTH